MDRLQIQPRNNWKTLVESQGLTFHSRFSPYWNEGVCYKFSSEEIDKLEKAGNDVNELCLQAAQHIIDKALFERISIPPHAAQLITDSWNADQLHLYGRFDFAYDGRNPAKMLEYNADTPTSLLEASVIQWYWLQDLFPTEDQFNSLHESLIERWKNINLKGAIHFTTDEEAEEDVMTTQYLRDTASQAGFETDFLDIQQIGYNAKVSEFRDLKERRIENLFKLYPWEWMIHQEFGQYLPSGTRFIEPPWKMLWSNKGILPVLWELFPGHPNLLPSYWTPEEFEDEFVKKPFLSREGANITLSSKEGFIETPGEYGKEGYIFQQVAQIPIFNRKRPILGIWIIGDEAQGMGIRESEGPITNNLSMFTPHYFVR